MNIPSPSPNLSKKADSPNSLFIPSDDFSASVDVLASNPDSSSALRRQLVTAWEVGSSTPMGPKTSCTSLSISPTQLRITREYVLRRKNRKWSRSALDARKPPIPMDMAPAIISARPPTTTILEVPKPDRPAVSAKGTVKPSDNPMIL